MVDALRFEFLDVGQGDGTLVEFAPIGSGELWLVDFGKKSGSDTPISDAVQFLVTRISEVCRARDDPPALPTIDRLIITHADGDHWNRLDNLIKGDIGTGVNLWQSAGWPANTQLEFERVVVGGRWTTYQNRNRALADLIDEQSVNTVGAFPANYSRIATPRWSVGGTDVYVLSANRGNGGDANPDSVVLLFEFAGMRVILTGDAESRIVEPAILHLLHNNLAFLESYLLKLGHHGSKASSSPDWLAAVQPKAVIASGDKRWGHPYAEPFDRARQYLDDDFTLHRFCASGGEEADDDDEGDADDYQNHNTERGAFTNLWYVVKQATMELEGPDDDGMQVEQEYEYGQYFGVQWSFEIGDDGGVSYVATEQWPDPDDSNPWGATGLAADVA